MAVSDANSVYVTADRVNRLGLRGYDTTFGGDSDAFLVKLTDTGWHLWSTYLGGEGKETGAGMAVDGSGAVYAGGSTNSPGWVSRRIRHHARRRLLRRLYRQAHRGRQHVWSTYIGGENGELADDFFVDKAGNVYMVGDVYVGEGWQASPWVSGGFDTTFNGGDYDGFLIKLTSGGAHAWSSFVGGQAMRAIPAWPSIPPASCSWSAAPLPRAGPAADSIRLSMGRKTPSCSRSPTGRNRAVTKMPVYRFWSAIYSRHFYTTSESEKQNLIDNFASVWTYEGIAYYALPDGKEPGSLPVYRFWSPSASAHFYTISEAEKDMLIRDFPNVWTFEGMAFYAYPEGAQPAGTSPVYRFWSARPAPLLHDQRGGEGHAGPRLPRDLDVRGHRLVRLPAVIAAGCHPDVAPPTGRPAGLLNRLPLCPADGIGFRVGPGPGGIGQDPSVVECGGSDGEPA